MSSIAFERTSQQIFEELAIEECSAGYDIFEMGRSAINFTSLAAQHFEQHCCPRLLGRPCFQKPEYIAGKEF